MKRTANAKIPYGEPESTVGFTVAQVDALAPSTSCTFISKKFHLGYSTVRS
jgi:hypothetical protein